MGVSARLFFVCTVALLLASCGGGRAGSDQPDQAAPQLLAGTQIYAEPQSGWFWNAAESGRGFAIERQGNQLFLAGFMYETNGDATWYTSTMTAQADGHYDGDLLRYTGGQTLLGNYKQPTPAKVGTLSASFSSAMAGIINVVPLTGTQKSISISHFPISTPAAFATSQAGFETGWWWNAAESGRGYFIESQGSQAFIGAFMYGETGQPTWYVSNADLQGPIGVSGWLDQYSGGQSLLGAYKAANKLGATPGKATFHLTSGNTGTLLLPNGTSVPLSRFDFNQVTPAGASSNLRITEVSTVYYEDDIAWFEVYNPNDVAVPLSDYSLRATSADMSTHFPSNSPTTFALPRVNVPAKGYLIVGGKPTVPISDNSQMVLVKKGDSVPFWQANGSIELVKGTQTADFVRFGTSSNTPLTSNGWSGASVAALPATENDHGKSIVRPAAGGMVDTNTAADWTLVDFATPAGKNDIAAGVTDSDHDGVPDSAKVAGNTYAGMDLYAMGARPGKRDIFIQIDHMKSGDPATTPRLEALQHLTAVFAAKNLSPQKNIVLHLDAGNLYSASFNPALFNLGGGKEAVLSQCIQLPTLTPDAGCNSLYDYKSAGFDVRRKLLFHYALFGSTQAAAGNCDSGGIGDVGGNNMLLTMGNCGFTETPGAELNLLVNGQASTLMHELGHNLGLKHGGDESNNFKPNYYSVMNYLYSSSGLSASPNGVNAADRYYYETPSSPKYATLLSPCDLEYSPCTTNFIMDYSDGSSINLNESALDESKNIGRGSVGGAFADWDNSGALTSSLLFKDIHQSDTTTSLQVLKDYNDWGNLVLPFTRNGYFGIGAAAVPLHKRAQRKNPMNDRALNVIREDPPSPKLLEAVRHHGKQARPPSRIP